jgi:ABC-type microcin C transport system permease subunit YejE
MKIIVSVAKLISSLFSKIFRIAMFIQNVFSAKSQVPVARSAFVQVRNNEQVINTRSAAYNLLTGLCKVVRSLHLLCMSKQRSD